MSTYHPIYAPEQFQPPPPPPKRSHGPIVAGVLVAAAAIVGAFFVGTTQASTVTPPACRAAIQEAAGDYGLFADMLDAITDGNIAGLQRAGDQFQQSRFGQLAADCLGTTTSGTGV